MSARPRVSQKAARFTESVIREMTRLSKQYDCVNLAQGFPDFPAPLAIKEAACRAIENDINQYAVTWGADDFRQALAEKHARFSGVEVDPDTEVTVTCGSTEAMLSSLLATVDPGDEVIVFEPWYENYGPDAILSGARPVYVQLRPPHWDFDPEELRRAFSKNTRGIIVNTPHNPTGKMFTKEELTLIGELAAEHDALVFTDEIYEHITYDGREHVYPNSLPELRERTVMISGLSKTYSVTGWRIGYVVAPPDVTAAIRKVHDFCTVGAPAPLQRAAVTAMQLPDTYYHELRSAYQTRRDTFVESLRNAGLEPHVPQGAYYVMARFDPSVAEDDVAYCRYLMEKVGVATVPASAFYRQDQPAGKTMVRFCYPKRAETLEEAAKRLQRLVG